MATSQTVSMTLFLCLLGNLMFGSGNHVVIADPTDSLGYTKLMKAIDEGDDNLALQLLDSGASIHQHNRQGWTPLLFAARRGNKELVEHLARAGANVDAMDQMGQTALTLATKGGHANTVELLLQHDADPHLAASPKHKAIVIALHNQDEPVIRTLASRGVILTKKQCAIVSKQGQAYAKRLETDTDISKAMHDHAKTTRAALKKHGVPKDISRLLMRDIGNMPWYETSTPE